MFRVGLLTVLIAATGAAADDSLRLLAWNVESGGSDPAVIAKQLSALGGYHVYGLTEVDPAATRHYLQALGDQYKSFVSVTSRHDRLQIIYDSNRLDLLGSAELDSHDGVHLSDINFNHRSPLRGRFRDKVTDVAFLVVLNHLVRGNSELRREQARALRLWVEDQELPAIAIGVYNFDFDFSTLRGNESFDEFMLDYRWRWVRPDPLVDTNWSDRDGDRVDDYPNSCLDFMFVGGKAYNWEAKSKVIVRDGDFPDDETTSDHRPVELTVNPR